MRLLICEKCQMVPKLMRGQKVCPHCQGPLTGTGGKSKFGNRWTTALGVRFQSKKEAERYLVLRAMETAGEITDLELQPKFELVVNGVRVGSYKGDFKYFSYLAIEDGELVIEDVKSPASRTEAYQLRRRLVEALYKIKITEV